MEGDLAFIKSLWDSQPDCLLLLKSRLKDSGCLLRTFVAQDLEMSAEPSNPRRASPAEICEMLEHDDGSTFGAYHKKKYLLILRSSKSQYGSKMLKLQNKYIESVSAKDFQNALVSGGPVLEALYQRGPRNNQLYKVLSERLLGEVPLAAQKTARKILRKLDRQLFWKMADSIKSGVETYHYALYQPHVYDLKELHLVLEAPVETVSFKDPLVRFSAKHCRDANLFASFIKFCSEDDIREILRILAKSKLQDQHVTLKDCADIPSVETILLRYWPLTATRLAESLTPTEDPAIFALLAKGRQPEGTEPRCETAETFSDCIHEVIMLISKLVADSPHFYFSS
jgi:hypothetical protein